MWHNKVKFITRTAILLALTIIFQMMGRYLGPNNNFIVGPLVNAALLISTAAAGLWSGTVIAVVAPFVSALTNKAAIAPIILAFSPFIAAGNFILVLCFHLLIKKNKILGMITGAVFKFAFLFITVRAFVQLASVPQKFATVLTALFSWSQLLTALVGGIIAFIVIKALKKNIEL